MHSNIAQKCSVVELVLFLLLYSQGKSFKTALMAQRSLLIRHDFCQRRFYVTRGKHHVMKSSRLSPEEVRH